MLEEGQGLGMWSTACHFVVEQAFRGAFEEAMSWCACAAMEAGYCVLVHVRLCSVQRILPRSKCAEFQDQAQLCVKHCIEFGSCSAVHWVASGGVPDGGYIL